MSSPGTGENHNSASITIYGVTEAEWLSLQTALPENDLNYHVQIKSVEILATNITSKFMYEWLNRRLQAIRFCLTAKEDKYIVVVTINGYPRVTTVNKKPVEDAALNTVGIKDYSPFLPGPMDPEALESDAQHTLNEIHRRLAEQILRYADEGGEADEKATKKKKWWSL